MEKIRDIFVFPQHSNASSPTPPLPPILSPGAASYIPCTGRCIIIISRDDSIDPASPLGVYTRIHYVMRKLRTIAVSSRLYAQCFRLANLTSQIDDDEPSVKSENTDFRDKSNLFSIYTFAVVPAVVPCRKQTSTTVCMPS